VRRQTRSCIDVPVEDRDRFRIVRRTTRRSQMLLWSLYMDVETVLLVVEGTTPKTDC